MLELERSLPARLITPATAPPRQPTKLSYTQRQELAKQRDLDSISELLETAKAASGRGIGDCWPCPLATPDTPGSPHATSQAQAAGQLLVLAEGVAKGQRTVWAHAGSLWTLNSWSSWLLSNQSLQVLPLTVTRGLQALDAVCKVLIVSAVSPQRV